MDCVGCRTELQDAIAEARSIGSRDHGWHYVEVHQLQPERWRIVFSLSNEEKLVLDPEEGWESFESAKVKRLSGHPYFTNSGTPVLTARHW